MILSFVSLPALFCLASVVFLLLLFMCVRYHFVNIFARQLHYSVDGEKEEEEKSVFKLFITSWSCIVSFLFSYIFNKHKPSALKQLDFGMANWIQMQFYASFNGGSFFSSSIVVTKRYNLLWRCALQERVVPKKKCRFIKRKKEILWFAYVSSERRNTQRALKKNNVTVK